MRLFGMEIQKAAPLTQVAENRGGWWPIIREFFPGAWQKNEEWTTDSVLAHHAVFSCITLIAADFGKLRPKLIQQDADGVWSEMTSPAFSPVLLKPNSYQTRNQFQEWWITSKLVRGNTYGLKVRDNRRIVTALYLLDSSRVTVLVAPDGSVFYQLSQDNLSGLQADSITVPASEIIHDRMNCLFHPLVGVSPIFACGTAANLGLKIQNTSTKFFAQGANPGGILTAPNKISQDTADRLKEHWDTNFTGDNAGRVAVLGEGLKFEAMRMTSVDSQLIEQLKWSAETVCATFHVPSFKVGIGIAPTYPVAVLNQIYYSDCLQALIEAFEAVMDEGLGLNESKDGKLMGVELDLDGLLRMDSASQVTTLAQAVGAGIMAPNEARKKLELVPVKGGKSPMIQQQNYSLAALDERDKHAPAPPSVPPTPPTVESPKPAAEDEKSAVLYWKHADIERELEYVGERKVA